MTSTPNQPTPSQPKPHQNPQAGQPAQTSPPDRKNRRLGRGLASLISIQPTSEPDAQHTIQAPPSGAPQIDQPGQRQPHAALANLLVVSIEPNPFQPRRLFDPEALAGLADSIRANGLVQPVLVRRHRDHTGPDPRFELIAGERRWRAAKLAGLDSIPAIIKSVDDDAAMELALVENIQRADLNAIERATAYRSMMDSRNMSLEDLARRLGESSASISNYVRLLGLPPGVQDMIVAGQLTYGHARTVLGLRKGEHQQVLAEAIVRLSLSVRQVEQIVSNVLSSPGGENSLERLLASLTAQHDGTVRPAVSRVIHEPPPKPANIVSLEEKLTRRLGTRVSIRQGRRADLGKVIIDFYCLDDFDRILDALGIAPD